MPVPVGALLLGLAKKQISKVIVKKAMTAIAKHQVKSQVRKAFVKGSYKVYQSAKNNRVYTVQDMRRDKKSVQKYIGLLKSRNLYQLLMRSKSIVDDTRMRMSQLQHLKKIQDWQKRYNLNVMDKIIFQLSQKNEGLLTKESLKHNAKEYFNNLFKGDTTVSDNFSKAFQEYIDFRVDALERIGFLNRRIDTEIFEVTDVFHDRLAALDLFNKEIPTDLDINKFKLRIIDDSIKNGGVNLDNVLLEFKNSTTINDPVHMHNIYGKTCEQLAKYGYLQKIDENNFKVTDRAVSELFMRRDLDPLEKSIYDFLKSRNSTFDKDEYVKYLREDKNLLNRIFKLLPKEKKEGKEFKFGKYDANILFKEFEDDKLSEEKLFEKLSEKLSDQDEVKRQFEIMLKRLKKNVDNGFLDYNENSKTFSINDKGKAEAEKVNKTFSFTSYDVNVIFNYIHRSNDKLSIDTLENLLKEEYKDPKEVEKQLNYLSARLEKNVQAGYLKYESDSFIISEKGLEEEQKLISSLDQNIDKKIDYLKNANLLNQELSIKPLFNDIVDRRLNEFDKLIYEISKLKDGKINEDLFDNVTLHYIYTLGDTKRADDKIKEFSDHYYKRLATLERINYIKKNEDGQYSTTENFDEAVMKQGQYKEKLYKPNEVDDLTKFHLYLLNQSASVNGINIADLLDNYRKQDISDPENKIKITIQALDKLTISRYVEYSNGKYSITSKGVDEIYNRRNLNMFEKFIYGHGKDNNWVLDYDKFLREIVSDNKLSDFVKRNASRDSEFKFGKFDYNMISKYFDENKQLDPNILKGKSNFKLLSKRLDKLESKGYIAFNRDSKNYSLTEKGMKYQEAFQRSQSSIRAYDVYHLFEKFQDNKLNLNDLKDDSNYNTMNNRLIELSGNGYLDFNEEINEFVLNEKGIEAADFIKRNDLSKSINKYSRLFDKEKKLKVDIINEKKNHEVLTRKLNNFCDQAFVSFDANNSVFTLTEKGYKAALSYRNKDFQFSKYDANVIFREFSKEQILKLDVLKTRFEKRFKDPEEARKNFEIFKSRLEKLEDKGYISFDKVTMQYSITEDGRNAAENVKKNFSFTDYDLNVVFKYINDNGNKLTFDELRYKIFNEYPEQEYAEKQYNYLIKRFDNNVTAGYLIKENGIYEISEKGKEQVNNKLKIYKDYLDTELSKLQKINFVNINDNTINLTNTFRNIVDRRINNLDNIIFEIASDNDGEISIDIINTDINYHLENNFEEFIQYFTDRKDSLVDIGYLIQTSKDTYRISDEFSMKMMNEIDKGIVKSSEKRNIEFKFSTYDQSIYNCAKNDIIDLTERRNFFDKKYKSRPKEAERQYNILVGRCNKLVNAEYLELNEKGFKIIKYPDKDDNISSSSIGDSSGSNKRKDVLETFKITKFDHDNISKYCQKNIWDLEYYKECNNNMDKELLNKKIASIDKRLNTLSEMDLAEKLDDGKWKINDILLERANLKPRELTKEQREILYDIKDFLNITDRQITENIYNGNGKIALSDINNLVNKGLLDYETRDLNNNDEFVKIYFITTEGKKEICKQFDEKMKDLYDSKIHSRPQELKHDVLIYSAYRDVKDSLESDGFKIKRIMTDRQLRAYDMSNNHQQRVEYPDLYVEFYDEKSGEEGYLNIEIDVGYSPSVIQGKAENISNLFWYTDSQNQAEKIVKYAKTNNVKIISF